MGKLSEDEMIEELKKIDTPTVGNVVATYPGNPLCLEIYDPWYGSWYTDTTICCMFPELGVKVGYAVTCIYSNRSEKYLEVDRWALPDGVRKSKKPVVLVCHQSYPPELENRCGLFGGNMTTQYRALGIVAVITDGPMRDLSEIREIGVQYYSTGVTPGHGPLMLRAVNVPVTVGGMTVTPGDFIHMDAHGAIKFPQGRMGEVLQNAKRLLEAEAEGRKIFLHPDFSVEKWKEAETRKESRSQRSLY